MAKVQEDGRQEKRPKSAWSSPSSPPVTEGTGDGDGDGAVARAHEKAKSKLFSNGGGNEKGTREGVTVTIDPDLLDCPICFEQLSPPIFQCGNGHLACSPCRSNVKNCPSCKSAICYRCLAVEKIVESFKVSCPYAGGGCEQVISYLNIREHKKMCAYAPCYCPTAGCTFEGPMRELDRHFTEAHRGCSTSLQYNRAWLALMLKDESFLVGRGDDGVLFLLLNKTELGMGNAVMVACLGPGSMEGKYTYRVKATDQMKVSSVQLESPMCNIMRWEGILPQKNFLLVPKEFDAWNLIHLEITIWSKGNTECGDAATQKGSTPSSKSSSGTPRERKARVLEEELARRIFG